MLDIIKGKLSQLKTGELVPIEEYKKAQTYYLNEDCQLLTQAQVTYDFAVMEEGEEKEVRLWFEEDEVYPVEKKKPVKWCA